MSVLLSGGHLLPRLHFFCWMFYLPSVSAQSSCIQMIKEISDQDIVSHTSLGNKLIIVSIHLLTFSVEYIIFSSSDNIDDLSWCVRRLWLLVEGLAGLLRLQPDPLNYTLLVCYFSCVCFQWCSVWNCPHLLLLTGAGSSKRASRKFHQHGLSLSMS